MGQALKLDLYANALRHAQDSALLKRGGAI
jgi:hypothetical protein